MAAANRTRLSFLVDECCRWPCILECHSQCAISVRVYECSGRNIKRLEILHTLDRREERSLVGDIRGLQYLTTDGVKSIEVIRELELTLSLFGQDVGKPHQGSEVHMLGNQWGKIVRRLLLVDLLFVHPIH